MQRKNFSFRFEWLQAIAHLEAAVRLEIYEQTVGYAETGSVTFVSAQAEEAFNEFILPDFRRREKAAAYRARRKAALGAKKNAEECPALPTAAAPGQLPAPATPLLNRRERRLMEAEARRLKKRLSRKGVRGGD